MTNTAAAQTSLRLMLLHLPKNLAMKRDWADLGKDITDALERLEALEYQMEQIVASQGFFVSSTDPDENGRVSIQLNGAEIFSYSVGETWRPMELAPKDGTHILIRAQDKKRYLVAAWRGGVVNGWIDSYSGKFWREPDVWAPLPDTYPWRTSAKLPSSTPNVQNIERAKEGKEGL